MPAKNTQDTQRTALIPCSVLCDRSLSFSEAAISYLHHTYSHSPSRIGEILGMDRRNVWTILKRAQTKGIPAPTKDGPKIPAEILSARTGSPLEAVVWHLKVRKGMKTGDIAKALNRSQTTIATAFARCRDKGGERP